MGPFTMAMAQWRGVRVDIGRADTGRPYSTHTDVLGEAWVWVGGVASDGNKNLVIHPDKVSKMYNAVGVYVHF